MKTDKVCARRWTVSERDREKKKNRVTCHMKKKGFSVDNFTRDVKVNDSFLVEMHP